MSHQRGIRHLPQQVNCIISLASAWLAQRLTHRESLLTRSTSSGERLSKTWREDTVVHLDLKLRRCDKQHIFVCCQL